MSIRTASRLLLAVALVAIPACDDDEISEECNRWQEFYVDSAHLGGNIPTADRPDDCPIPPP